MKTQGILIILFILFWNIACNSKIKSDRAEKAIPVKTVFIESKTISIPIHSSGRLYPETTKKLSFKTGGIIKKIYVNEGDEVNKGELIAELDLSEVKAYYNKAEKGLQKAKRDLKRVSNLFKDKAATIEQMQNVKTVYDISQSNLRIAKFNLKHSKVFAPDKGKILKKLAEENELIASGYPIFLFGSTANDWIVKCGVSEKDLLKIKHNDIAQIKLSAYKKMFSGYVSEISDSLDPSSGTYELKIRINDEGKRLVTGFIASVDIIPSVTNKYSLIPYDCLIDCDGDTGYIFKIEKDKAVKQAIKIKHLFKDKAAVIYKKTIPSRAVSEGAPYLVNGSKVIEIN